MFDQEESNRNSALLCKFLNPRSNVEKKKDKNIPEFYKEEG